MLELIRNLAIHLAVELDLHYEDDERGIADSLMLLQRVTTLLSETPEEVQHVLNRFNAVEHRDAKQEVGNADQDVVSLRSKGDPPRSL